MPVSYTFPTGIPNPTSDFGYDEEPRVRVAKFGDGYKQTVVDGLNARERTLSPVWQPLTLAQMILLRGFFRDRAGSQPFFWKPPNETDTMKVRCTKWSVKQMGTKAHWSITASFEECFDP